MSENKPITPKEKMLTAVLVRLYSKETLEKEIRDVLESHDEKWNTRVLYIFKKNRFYACKDLYDDLML